MSTRDVDSAALLRTEGREAAADERTLFRDDSPSARTASKPPPERDSGRLSGETDEGSDDHNRNTQRGSDQIVIDHRALEDWIFGSEQVAVPLPCDVPSTPRPVGASLRQRNGQTQVKPLPPKFEEPSKLLSRPFNFLHTPVSPLRRNLSTAVLILSAGTTVIMLVHHFVLRPSDPRTDFSGTSRLASTNSQPVKAPLPLSRTETPAVASGENTPAAGSLNAIQPASFRDIVDQGSYETKTPGSLPPVVSANVNVQASSKNTPPSEVPQLASIYSRPVAEHTQSLPPIEAVPLATQRSAPSSGSASETTASLSQNPPSSESKAIDPHGNATQPHIDTVSRRKRDEKTSQTVETRWCTADIFPEHVHASSRMKPGQLDVKKLCADQHFPFTVSLRCLVASVICPDHPAEKESKVVQKATPARRVP
jgi:hypothetical protein